jgi:hypothetical protein
LWGRADEGLLRPWNGAIYQVAYDYRHEGGAWSLHRLDVAAPKAERVAHATFEENTPHGPLVAMIPSNDTATEWTWEARCFIASEGVTRSCEMTDSPYWQMVAMRTLRPVEGARTLAVFGPNLVEVCDRGTRQIYRAFPFGAVTAVDAAGRPLVVFDNDVLRWSPRHGWRALYVRPRLRTD